jgi:hypothetical protein
MSNEQLTVKVLHLEHRSATLGRRALQLRRVNFDKAILV